MKRVVAIVLCLLAMTGFALADDTRVEFGDTFSLMRPDSLEVVELGEDEEAEDMVYAATSDELEMYVWAYDLDGLTAEELYESCKEDEFFENVQELTLGDHTYLTYDIVDEGVGAVFVCENGKYYDFIFYCETEEAQAQAQEILDSIESM